MFVYRLYVFILMHTMPMHCRGFSRGITEMFQT